MRGEQLGSESLFQPNVSCRCCSQDVTILCDKPHRPVSWTEGDLVSGGGEVVSHN